MMIDELTVNDFDMIIESLNHTRRAFENYPHYPSFEFKLQRLQTVDELRTKVSALRKQRKQQEAA